jgi:hypothetical protein
MPVERVGTKWRAVLTPLERFLGYCEFQPETGCVVWIGGRVRGRGKHGWYGAFWDGRPWRAHRWAAKHIHGLDIDAPSTQVDHNCPNIERPNTLCVQHLQLVPAHVNRELQWIRAEVGIDPPPLPSGDVEPGMVPYYEPPRWLRLATNDTTVKSGDSCPF